MALRIQKFDQWVYWVGHVCFGCLTLRPMFWLPDVTGLHGSFLRSPNQVLTHAARAAAIALTRALRARRARPPEVAEKGSISGDNHGTI